MNHPATAPFSVRVQLSPRAAQQVASLSPEEFVRYEDALMELSLRLTMAPLSVPGHEHLLEVEGCSLLYRVDAENREVMLRRVYCTPRPENDDGRLTPADAWSSRPAA